MKALVTGATGFVGSHLVEVLRREGHEVTALVRSPSKAAALDALGARRLPGDLHDPSALARAVEGQDVIFHVAGLVAARNEAEFLRGNRDATANVLDAAFRAGTGRILLVSSMAAGGPAALGRPLEGTEPARPVTAYGRSKLAGEEILREGGVPWTIVRPPMVYGPRDREVLKVFKLARLGLAPVFGGGGQELTAIHGADLATALVAAATSASTEGRLYYASHPEIFTSADFARGVGQAVGRRPAILRLPPIVGRVALSVAGTLADLTGRPTILTRDKANEFFQPAWTCDPSALTRDTGWRATRDLTSGLAETYEWYRSAGWI